VRVRLADGAEMEDAVVAPDPRAAGDHVVRADRGALADLHLAVDHRVRADCDARTQPGARVDDRAGMDAAQSRRHSWRSVHRSSASAATASPTRAMPLNFPMPRLAMPCVTSIVSWSPGTTGRSK